MKRLLSIACTTVLAGALSLATLQPAEAGNSRRAALITGLVVGGVAATVLTDRAHRGPRYHVHRGHGVRYGRGYAHPRHFGRGHVHPRVVHRRHAHRRHVHRSHVGRGNVWRQHVSYCYGRYRSYNHSTNQFLAYSGRYRTCRSPFIR